MLRLANLVVPYSEELISRPFMTNVLRPCLFRGKRTSTGAGVPETRRSPRRPVASAWWVTRTTTSNKQQQQTKRQQTTTNKPHNRRHSGTIQPCSCPPVSTLSTQRAWCEMLKHLLAPKVSWGLSIFVQGFQVVTVVCVCEWLLLCVGKRLL